MARRLFLASCTALFAVATASGALACDTSSWLQAPGPVAAGAVVEVRGGGLDAGPVTLVWDRTAGPAVGEGVVGADGRVTVEVTIPPAAAGAHKLIAVSPHEGASPADTHAWTAVTVATAAPAAAPAVLAPVGKGAEVPGATRGAALALVVAVAATVAAGGLGAAVAARRRRNRPLTAHGDELDAELRLLLDGVPRPTPAANVRPGG